MFVLDQIRAHALRSPDKLAIAFNGRPVSYGEFWRLIGAARRLFEAEGLGGEGVAVTAIDSVLDGWVLDLALRSLGLTTAMIRVEDQMALFAGPDLACVVTLTSEARRARAAAGARHIEVDPSSLDLGPGAADAWAPMASPGGHILMTSGTTGRYKKVLTTTGATADAIEAKHDRYGALGASFVQQGPETILAAFDFGLWTAAGYIRPIVVWCQGGGVIFQNGPDYAQALRWPGVTHTLVTPFFLSQLMAAPPEAIPYLPQMQLIVVAGALSKPLADETRRRLTGKMVVTLSATEVGGWARTSIDNDEDLRWYRLDPSREVQVVDDDGAPLAFGQLGQVRIRRRDDGPTGYLDDPEGTAKFFSDGWFYPGDLAILDGEGRIALFGRVTDLIHIKGDKHPAEPLERGLQERLGCEGVCVLSAPGEDQVEVLHVFIESRRAIGQAELQQAASAVLWGFPSAYFHFPGALPRTASGKIKRLALASQFHAKAVSSATAAPDG